jgi:hypothetical protein
MSQLLPATREISIDPAKSRLESWQDLFQQHCNIWSDHDDFVAGAELDDESLPSHFDGLRRIFPDRLEYERFIVKQQLGSLPVKTLQKLGFKTKV